MNRPACAVCGEEAFAQVFEFPFCKDCVEKAEAALRIGIFAWVQQKREGGGGRGKSPEPSKVPEALVCNCELDESGHCPKCQGEIAERVAVFDELATFMGAFFKKVDKDRPGCRACSRRYADGHMAGFVRERLSGVHPEVRALLLAIIANVGFVMKMPMPETERAILEIQQDLRQQN